MVSTGIRARISSSVFLQRAIPSSPTERKSDPIKVLSSNTLKTPKDPVLQKPIEKKITNKIVKGKVPTQKINRGPEPIKTASSTTKDPADDAVQGKQGIKPKETKRTASKTGRVIDLQTSPFDAPPALETMPGPTESADSKAEKNPKTALLKAPGVMAGTPKSGQNDIKQTPGTKTPSKKVPAYPYSLYIGSFKTLKRADKAVSIYTRKGLRPAYKVKVLLSNGEWYRVYMGYFESSESAERFRLDNELTETEVKKTQYANLIGTYSSTATLENKMRSLEENGFYSYVITDEGGKYRLFVGAFQPASRAERQRQELESRGIPNKIVER